MKSHSSKKRPKVSVIVPVYNVESYIAKCLLSLQCQILSDIEIILVDDCGSDASMDIARQFARKDPRILLLNGTQNQGAGRARNRGMKAARGEYLAFVDPDDWVAPDFLQLLYEKAIAEQADIVTGNCCICKGGDVHTDGMNQNAAQCLRESRWIGHVLRHNFCTCLYRSKIQRQHQISFPPLRNGEDVVFQTNFLLQARKIALEEQAIYFYFQRTGSSANTVDDTYFDSVFAAKKLKGELINRSRLPIKDKIEYWHANLIWYLIYAHLPRMAAPSREFYLDFFARVKTLFLGSGHAKELCATYPSDIYQQLLLKTPEEITDFWMHGLVTVDTVREIDTTACAWRYPVYCRRYHYNRIMSIITTGKRRKHYMEKKMRYRELLRAIRRSCQKTMNSLGLPW